MKKSPLFPALGQPTGVIPRKRLTNAIPSDDDWMFPYIDENVWPYYGEDAQRILLHYADEEIILMPEMCRHLTGDKDPGEILEQCAGLGPLLSKTEGGYRIPEAYREYLIKKRRNKIK